jgi:hypothetical protein
MISNSTYRGNKSEVKIQEKQRCPTYTAAKLKFINAVYISELDGISTAPGSGSASRSMVFIGNRKSSNDGVLKLSICMIHL